MFLEGSVILNPVVSHCRGSEILNLLLCSWRGSEILNPFQCSLEIKFWTLPCVLCGIRNSESSSVLFGGSEVLNPSLCSSRDQKLWVLSSVVWWIRNSDTFAVFFGDQKSESFPVWFGESKIMNRLSFSTQERPEARNSKIIWVFFACLKHFTAIQIKNRTLPGRIFWFLANRETFYVSFNTSLRFRGYCKSYLWHKVAIMHFYLSSTFYLRPILH